MRLATAFVADEVGALRTSYPIQAMQSSQMSLVNRTGILISTAYETLSGFQWFFIINALCWKHKDNMKKRRYEKSVLLIARKSGKSFLVALIFLILLLIEPELSELYSVAPDRELSSIVKKELENTINASPLIAKHFKITRSEIRCLLTKSKFVPLACSENRLDGKLICRTV